MSGKERTDENFGDFWFVSKGGIRISVEA
jgi:hypothetical protein